MRTKPPTLPLNTFAADLQPSALRKKTPAGKAALRPELKSSKCPETRKKTASAVFSEAMAQQHRTPKDPLVRTDRRIVHGSKMLKAIQKRSRTAVAEVLSPTESQVARGGGVARKHISAISVASRLGNFLVTFRPAGKFTLARLEDGAAAKGHDILEKTLKPGALKKQFGDQRAREILKNLNATRLAGLVAVWGRYSIDGLYLTKEGVERLEEKGETPAYNSKGQPFLSARLDRLGAEAQKSLLAASFGEAENFNKYFFTGDYDMHDIISFSQRPHPVPSDSAEERFVIDAMNAAVSAVDGNRPFSKKSHNVVQHGPQYNYVAYMRSSEPDVALVPAVANPSVSAKEPLFVVDRGNWTIVKSRNDLARLYESKGIVIKKNWS